MASPARAFTVKELRFRELVRWFAMAASAEHFFLALPIRRSAEGEIDMPRGAMSTNICSANPGNKSRAWPRRRAAWELGVERMAVR